MSWAAEYVKQLEAGERISFRPKGRSMEPKIYSGQLVTVEPVALDSVRVGDVVLCRVASFNYLHNVVARKPDGSCLIANNKGRENGWTRRVYGRVVDVQP